MTTKTFRAHPRPGTPPSSNGNGSGRRVMVAPPKSRVRLPELAVGLFVMVLFALGAVLWHLNSVDKTPALAVAADIDRGDTIGAGDIRVVYVASDDPLALLGESQMSEVVGRVALVDLPAGTLVTRGMVAEAVSLAPGEGITGLSLDPGQYPASGLAPGDRVNVVLSVGADAAVGPDSETVIARDTVVYAVEDLASDRKLVSIMTGEADAEAVAARAGSGSLRLVLVAP